MKIGFLNEGSIKVQYQVSVKSYFGYHDLLDTCQPRSAHTHTHIHRHTLTSTLSRRIVLQSSDGQHESGEEGLFKYKTNGLSSVHIRQSR